MAKRVGRPLFEITDDIIQKAESYASRGLNREQIADALGMGLSTMYEKMEKYPDFMEALKRGKAKGIAHVANCLIKNAENGNASAQIFYLKCQANWKDTDTLEISGKDGDAIKIQNDVILKASDTFNNVMQSFANDKEKLSHDKIYGKPDDK
jgi:hypothetical protein